jgi:hypothetical protein
MTKKEALEKLKSNNVSKEEKIKIWNLFETELTTEDLDFICEKTDEVIRVKIFTILHQRNNNREKEFEIFRKLNKRRGYE